jgi:hypothetical protein
MIDFKCNCAICHRLISKKNYPFEIDGIKLNAINFKWYCVLDYYLKAWTMNGILLTLMI